MKKSWMIALVIVLVILSAGAVDLGAQVADTSTVSPAGGNAEGADAPVTTVWNALLQNREEELAATQSSLEELRKRLPEEEKRLSDEWSKLTQEFGHTLTIIQISRGRPLELSIAEDSLSMLRRRLATVRSSLDESVAYLSSQHESLSRLVFKDGELSDTKSRRDASPQKAPKGAVLPDERVTAFLSRLRGTLDQITTMQAMLDAVLLPADELDTRIAAQQKQLSERMPELWKNYYLSPEGRFLSLENWKEIRKLPEIMRESYRVRLLVGTPSGFSEWMSVLARMLTALLPLYLLVYAAYRAVKILPEPFASGCARIARISLPWVGWGLACHAAAWSGDGHYSFLSMLGTMLLCLGQLLLAWSLYRFENPDKDGRAEVTNIMVPQIAGLLLFLFNLPAPILGLLWIGVIVLCLRREHTTKRASRVPGLIRALIGGHTLMLWLALILTILGWGRLSILLCMAYAALAVCVLQAVGILHVSGLINSRLPPRGVSALIGGLGLALIVPLLLVLLTCSSALWGVAYPGFTTLLEYASTRNISVGKTSFNMVQILLILSVFYLCRSLVKVGRGLIAEYAFGSKTFEPGLVAPFQAGYTYALWLLFVLYVLHALGVSLSSMSMIAGGLSVGVGLGLQNVIKDFVCGMQLLFGKTLRVGDIIDVDDQMATVKQITIRHTLVETFDNSLIFIPNGDLLAGRLTNWTRNGVQVRRTVSVGVAYGSDVNKVVTVLREIASAHPHVLSRPAPMVIFSDFGASTLDFVVYVRVDNINNGLSVVHDIRVEIERRFREENIEIAFPQMDVHLKHELTGQV